MPEKLAQRRLLAAGSGGGGGAPPPPHTLSVGKLPPSSTAPAGFLAERRVARASRRTSNTNRTHNSRGALPEGVILDCLMSTDGGKIQLFSIINDQDWGGGGLLRSRCV